MLGLNSVTCVSALEVRRGASLIPFPVLEPEPAAGTAEIVHIVYVRTQ